MLDKIIPKKLKLLFELIRFNKPIGFMLLMWPCWFSLALVEENIYQVYYWYIYLCVGSFLMRSAGCIINDLVDINLDGKVERTFKRPLASKKISIFESIFFLIILLVLAFLILTRFNLNAILFALFSIPLIIIYPFLKRYTYWPQLGLGIVFGWGVLIVSIQFVGKISFNSILLYVACIFWTLAYDTIYAYQDRLDDINSNIKSTAVLFNNMGKAYVLIFYNIFFVIIGFLGFYSSKSFISLIVIILLIIVMNIYLKKWQLNSKQSCNYYFNFNNVIGLFCFIFLFLF